MIDENDIKRIEGAVDRVVEKRLDDFGKTIGTRFDAFEKAVDTKFDDFAQIVNLSFADVQKELLLIHKRIDTLTSNVDHFIHLHQKVDQELTMMRARIERMEEQMQQLQARFA